jgi:hypothetical protein
MTRLKQRARRWVFRELDRLSAQRHSAEPKSPRPIQKTEPRHARPERLLLPYNGFAPDLFVGLFSG